MKLPEGLSPVKLETDDGDLAAWVFIKMDRIWPAIISWKDRKFVLAGHVSYTAGERGLRQTMRYTETEVVKVDDSYFTLEESDLGF